MQKAFKTLQIAFLIFVVAFCYCEFRLINNMFDLRKNLLDLQTQLDIQQINQIQKNNRFKKEVVEILIQNNKRIIQLGGFLFEVDKDITNLNEIIKKIENESFVKNPEKYVRANLYISNFTAQVSGSGTNIKINDKYYILTAAHLLKEDTDELKVFDNSTMYDVELVKINREVDLALLAFKDGDKIPYVEIAKKEPLLASEVMLVGNPGGMIDIITVGHISKYTDTEIWHDTTSYFGNSGGALYYQGKLIGVASKIRCYGTIEKIGLFSIAVRLNTIKEFLKGVK